MSEAKEQKDESNLSDLLCADIKAGMIYVTKTAPINNAGSFALTLLWQIYEEAYEYLEYYDAAGKLSDEVIEGYFRAIFPEFISGYPTVMKLDT